MPFNIGGSILSSSMLTPDGAILPKNFKRVTSDMVDTVYNQNCTITSQGNDSTGGYSISYYFNNGGCGGTESGLYFTIKNTIPWSRVLCKFTNNGSASCCTCWARRRYHCRVCCYRKSSRSARLGTRWIAFSRF